MHSSVSLAALVRNSARPALDAPKRALVSALRNDPSACATSSGMVIINGYPPSVAAQDQCLDRQQQRLNPQQQRVHETDAVDHVQPNRPGGTGLLGGYLVVIAGIGVDDAAAARGHAIETVLVERLHESEQRARPRDILRLEELFAGSELAGRDVILHVGDDHRDDDPWLGYAGRFAE